MVLFRLFPVYSGTILVHSVSLRFIPESFRLVPAYSCLFRYVPFRSIPFLCLVTPGLAHANFSEAFVQQDITLIEKDHLDEWSPEKDCCLRLTFRQPVRKPSSKSSDSLSQLKIQNPW